MTPFNQPVRTGQGDRADLEQHATAWPCHSLPARPALELRHLASSRRLLSRGAWLFPGRCRSFSRFVCSFNHRRQFQLGLFGSAMMAMVQRLDAGSFFFHPLLSVFIFLALVPKVCRNRFSCHDQSVAELAPPELSNFGRSATFHGSPRKGGGSSL